MSLLLALMLAGQVTLVPGTAMTYTDGTNTWAGNPFCGPANAIPTPQPSLQCVGTLYRVVAEFFDVDGNLDHVTVTYGVSVNKVVDCVLTYNFVPRTYFPDDACAPYSVPCFDPDRDKAFPYDGNMNMPGFHCPLPGSAIGQSLVLSDGSPCLEWYGLGADLGACEYVPNISPTIPADPVGLVVNLNTGITGTHIYFEYYRGSTFYDVQVNGGPIYRLTPEPYAGEDFVGEITVGPDGTPDVHLIVPTTGITDVLVTDDGAGVWRSPVCCGNWMVLIK